MVPAVTTTTTHPDHAAAPAPTGKTVPALKVAPVPARIVAHLTANPAKVWGPAEIPVKVDNRPMVPAVTTTTTHPDHAAAPAPTGKTVPALKVAPVPARIVAHPTANSAKVWGLGEIPVKVDNKPMAPAVTTTTTHPDHAAAPAPTGKTVPAHKVAPVPARIATHLTDKAGVKVAIKDKVVSKLLTQEAMCARTRSVRPYLWTNRDSKRGHI
jgi:hypothetical protein